MALWLVAAIVAIVVVLTPGLSQAHEGHGVTESRGPAIVVEIAIGGVQASLRTSALDAAGDRALGEIRSAERHCADPCCGGGVHSSSCCCAIGLAPALEPAASRTGPEGCPLPADARNQPSIALEALPEPPRPLA